jgi:hypothetical protein
MIELQIFITPSGVTKTQVVGPAEQHPDGLRIYEKILPMIRAIDAVLPLSGDGTKQESRPEDAR